MTLSPSLDAAPVLDDLRYMIYFAEQGTGLRVVGASVELLAITNRTAGAGIPTIGLLTLGGDLTRADAQRLQFQLKRAPTPNFEGLPEQLQEAVASLKAGLLALASLKDTFAVTAKMEFKFELTSEAKGGFLMRFGARSIDSHSLTVEVEAV